MMLGGATSDCRLQSQQVAADNAQQILNGKYNFNLMETFIDYRLTETLEGLRDSKELPTNIPLVSHVQTRD